MVVASDSVPAHPAATVVLLRDSPPELPGASPLATSDVAEGTARGPEVLLVQRSRKLQFYGGAWVFPGGRVDAADRACNEAAGRGYDGAANDVAGRARDATGLVQEVAAGGAHDGTVGWAADPDLQAARVAAVREVREETGLEVEADALVAFACWTTPDGYPKRFRTWFFVGMADAQAEVRVDGGEIRAHRWLSPGEALAARDAGAMELPAPTFVTLLTLCDHGDATSAVTALGARPPSVFTPRVVPVPDGICYLYEGDAGYAAADPALPGPRHRLWMRGRSYAYERVIDLESERSTGS